MDVALIIPRDPPGLNNFHQVPIGSLYTGQQLRSQGDHVAFYDLRLHDGDDESAYREIAGASLAVVFSTDYDLAQCYPSLTPAAQCVRHLKRAGAPVVACAGSHGTADGELTHSFTGADVIVSGEFEFAVPDLVRSLACDHQVPKFWPAGAARVASAAELAELGQPAYELAPMDRYFSEGFTDGQLDRVRSGLVLGNRGCPFACSFCYLLFGRRLRRRPVEATLAELATMVGQHGIRHFFFLDYTFTLDRSWVAALCDGIGRLGLDVSWVCQTRVDCLDEPTLMLMRSVGCDGVWLGVESPDLEQRRYLSKGRIAFDEIEEGIATIRRCGLAALAFVMVGLPQETEASLAKLNAWLDSSGVYYSLSTFQRRLGTPLAADWTSDDLRRLGWGYLDKESEYLGESQLRIADLSWFFEYHERSATRVKNVMRQRLAAHR